MNELNLQNRKFREKIHYLKIDRSRIHARITVMGIYLVETVHIFSYDNLLTNNQRWFSDFGIEVFCLGDLDQFSEFSPRFIK